MSTQERPRKTVSASRTEQAQILMYDTLNGYKRLFGGRLMEWIDVVACVTARRHCGCNVKIWKSIPRRCCICATS